MLVGVNFFSYSLGDAIDWKPQKIHPNNWNATPLLARGRDRLETMIGIEIPIVIKEIPYSLGDAIDWKQLLFSSWSCLKASPLLARGTRSIGNKRNRLLPSLKYALFPYSLGDAIDWKLFLRPSERSTVTFPLLARGRDRLETNYIQSNKY